VKKAIREVPNAPVVTQVKRVLVTMGLVNHVGRVIPVNPTTQTRLRARHATRVTTKKNRAKRLVCRAFLERMKTILVQKHVKFVRSDNIKTHLAMKRV
jgi:hypothetical protein